MTTTYEMTTGTREEFDVLQAQLISDFAAKAIGSEVNNRFFGNGSIITCENPCNDFESMIFTVCYDLGETKRYGACVALATGNLRFVDETLFDLYKSFEEAHKNLRHQLALAKVEADRRAKEEAKAAKKRKEVEKKVADMKASAENEITKLANREKVSAVADDFYYALGWLAKHVGTITAKMPDYLESSFVKHFGDVERTVVDSTKVGPAGYTSQWRLSMEASLKKAESIPATLVEYLSQSGKKVSKTSFVWSLIDDYGFKLGKKQDFNNIIGNIPVEYTEMFTAGFAS